jgi:trehalose 6-phosphate synthase
MGRLVAVSNRVGPVKGAARAGGLAVALVDALLDRKGLWFGWSGKVSEEQDALLNLQEVSGMTLATLDLTQSEFDDYYNGFANRCLWPLFHFRVDLTLYDRQFFHSYERVNAHFARELLPLLKDDDCIWVHDYHLFLLAAELRKLGSKHRIGYFLHIPFPPPEILVTLPHHQELLRGLFAHDLVGFQTRDDLQRFRDCVVREMNGEVDDKVVIAFGRRTRADFFPIGIDAAEFQKLSFAKDAADEFQRMRAALRGRDQVIGVDRLDYTKGLLRRMHAFESFLKRYPQAHRKVEFLQIAPVSRGEVGAYRSFRRQLEQLAGQINGQLGDFDWSPVRYMNKAVARRQLAGLYRASRVGLVTPMRDGMNLVAKEYVAAQDPEDPGVLVLSRFAGAARQMTEALIVNPYDVDEVADAIQRALDMSVEERKRRHALLMAGLVKDDVKAWRERFVAELGEAPSVGEGDRSGPETQRVRQFV